MGTSSRFLLSSLSGLAIVGACAAGVLAVQAGGNAAAASVRTQSATSGRIDNLVSGYRDGSFSAVGRYATPGGDESIGVTVQIAHQRITAVAVAVEAKSPTAMQFQEQFSTRILPAIVSRDLASAGVSRVAGASLTSLGFNNALQQIRTNAHA